MQVATEQQEFFGWLFVFIYIIVILFFVIRGALKTKSIEDYALGNLKFSPLSVALSFAAATTSAATFIINPGFVALYGLSAFVSYGLVYPFSAIVSFILLSKAFRKFGSTVKAGTMAQWVGIKYNSKFLEIYFAFLSLLLITFIVLILVGISQVFSKLLNVDVIYVLTFSVVFIFGYMMFGGANSMVYTNSIQAFVMIITSVIMLSSGIEFFLEGNFSEKLSAIDSNLLSLTNPNSPLFRDFFEIGICQIIVGLAIICQPHILTKSLLLKSDKDTNKYLLYGSIVQFLFFLVVFTGFYARISFPELKINNIPLKMDEIIPTYIVIKFNVFISILLVFGVVSAGISTLEGLIQSLSTTITVDLIKKNLKITEKISTLLINKIVILMIAIISWYFAYDQIINPKLSVAIFAQVGVFGYFASNFIPILFGIFLKNPNKIAVTISSIVAIIIHFWIFYIGYFPFLSKYMFDLDGNPLVVRNPGISAAVSIFTSTVLGFLLQYLFLKQKIKE